MASVIALILGSRCALGAAAAWDGGSVNFPGVWGIAQNWDPDGIPTSGTDVTLGGGIKPNDAVVLTQDALANSLTIGTINPFATHNNGFDWTLTLTSGNVTRQDLPGVEGDQLLVHRVALGNNGVWSVAGSGKLYVEVLTGIGRNLTKTGGALLEIDNATYGGTTTINQGTLRIHFFSANAGPISIGAGTELQISSGLTAASMTIGNTLLGGSGVLRHVSGASNLSGLITLGGSFTASAAQVFSDSGTLTLSGGIADGAGSRSWVKNGAGTVVLSGPGSYTGTTFVNNGTLSVQRSDALGSGPVVVAPGTVLEIGDATIVPNAISLGGALSHKTAGVASAAGAVTLTGDATVDVQSGPGALTVAGPISDNGSGVALTKIGAGTLVIGGTASYAGATSVTGGKVVFNSTYTGGSRIDIADGAVAQLAMSATMSHNVVLKTSGLDTHTSGKADLVDNKLILAGGDLAAVTSLVKSGYHGGAWDGGGIITSGATAATGLGVARAQDVGLGGQMFGGVPISAGDVLVSYTLFGDADLDAGVDFVDLVRLAQNYGTSGKFWSQGDFNYDGNVGFGDLVKLAQNYGGVLPGEAIPGAPAGFADDLMAAFAQAPEPGMVRFLAAIAGVMMSRRRQS